MSKHLELLQTREKEVANIIRYIDECSQNFMKPKLVLIGGYAIRAFVPYSRASRDCDFVVSKKEGWNIEIIDEWRKLDVSAEVLEKKETYGFLKWVKSIPFGKHKANVSIDFLEGEVRGRTEKEIVFIDKDFIDKSEAASIKIADQIFNFNVPRYIDYLIMKIVSGRPSDIRDVSTLLWKKGVPSSLDKRVNEILPYPEIFADNIKTKLIPIVSDKRFLYSWKGTYVTKDFNEESRSKVLAHAESML